MVKKIYLKELVGEKAVEPDKGENVKKIIISNIKSGNKVELYFDGITSMLSLFLNTAIGDLYGVFSEEEIKANLAVKNVPKEYLDTLQRVIERAKKFYKNQDEVTKMIDEVIEND
jgi:hypothetical protein